MRFLFPEKEKKMIFQIIWGTILTPIFVYYLFWVASAFYCHFSRRWRELWVWDPETDKVRFRYQLKYVPMDVLVPVYTTAAILLLVRLWFIAVLFK